jgi:hypothetical protein
MKKTLVAIAAFAALGAQAQSSVTIEGYMDRGYTKVNNTNDKKDVKSVSSSAGTTSVRILGVEDIGNGQKVGFRIDTDWSEAGGLTQDGASSTYAAGTAGGNIPSAGGSFGNAQSFLYFDDAKLGRVQLGNVNNEILNTLTGVGAPFSTGVGSAYSSSWSVLNGYGTGATNRNNQVVNGAAGASNGGVRGIRQVNTIKYVSPKIEGFTFAIGQALKNDNGATVGAASETSTVGATDMSLTYANGPLTAQYASLKYKVGADATINGGKTDATQTAGLTANSTNTHTATAVSYAVLPELKLSGAWGGSKASADSIANSKFTQYGVTYTMGMFDIMAQTAKVNDKNATDFDRKMTGLGLNYNMSKTARAYVRYDKLDMDTAHVQAAQSGSVIKRTAIGISKSF